MDSNATLDMHHSVGKETAETEGTRSVSSRSVECSLEEVPLTVVEMMQGAMQGGLAGGHATAKTVGSSSSSDSVTSSSEQSDSVTDSKVSNSPVNDLSNANDTQTKCDNEIVSDQCLPVKKDVKESETTTRTVREPLVPQVVKECVVPKSDKKIEVLKSSLSLDLVPATKQAAMEKSDHDARWVAFEIWRAFLHTTFVTLGLIS